MHILVHGLTILFVGLKLTGQIDWPWWQVLLIQIVLICMFLLSLALQLLARAMMTPAERALRDLRRSLSNK